MKFFLDTIHPQEVIAWQKTGLIKGITTNPSLLARAKIPVPELLLELFSCVQGDISVEVTEKEPEKVYEQALKIASFGPKAVVKIPFLAEYGSIIYKLSSQKVRVNVTLLFTSLQALCAAQMGATYLSLFVGRLDDIGHDGMQQVEELVLLKARHQFLSTILVASARTVMHVHQAALAGADAITVLPSLLEKVLSPHPLTKIGLEAFLSDWEKSGADQLIS